MPTEWWKKEWGGSGTPLNSERMSGVVVEPQEIVEERVGW